MLLTKKAEKRVRWLINEINYLLGKGKISQNRAYKRIERNWRIWLKVVKMKPEPIYLIEVVDFLGWMTKSPHFKKFIPYLKKYLNHPDNNIRSNAQVALGICGLDRHFHKFLQLLKTDRENRYLLVDLISNFSERFEADIVNALAWVIRRQRAQDQWYALQSIAYWDNPISDKTIAWAAKYAKVKNCRQLAKRLLAKH